MDFEKIGKFIATSRKKKNLTQEQLAEILNVNNRTISRWENGRNMPDISLFKLLCKTLDISVEELINGEVSNNKDKSYEKAIISTISSNIKISKRLKKILLLLIISIIVSLAIIIYYKNKYPKIDIYNIKTITSEENKLNKDLTEIKNNYKIWFYGIDSVQLSDNKNNYYDLNLALKYNQVTINDVKDYLENQYNNGSIERHILYDGGTKIYKSKTYEVIVCNTLDKNKDIYFGGVNLANNLKGEYCGKKKDNTCYFTRTYHIVSIKEDNDEDIINVTLKSFQGDIDLVKLDKSNKLQVGNNYEFTFRTYDNFDDNISNIFNNSTLISVKETLKQGLEQVNDKICVN